MARMNIRYLTVRTVPSQLPRYFWQPSAKLRKAGYRLQRVPLDWERFTDVVALEAAAIARAQALNAELDDSRAAAAIASVRPPAAPAQRTLGELITHYKQSRDWLGLADKTQRGYLQCLGKIEVWGADAPIRSIDATRIQRLIENLRATPSYANAVARVLRLLLEHGRRNGFLQINPAIRPGLTSTAPTGLIWPRGAVTAFVAAADRLGRHSIGTAVLLNEWLGQRQVDIRRMPWHVLRNGTLWVRQTKRGAGVALPVNMVAHLVTRLEQEKVRHAERTARFALEDEATFQRTGTRPNRPASLTMIVNEATGLPYKEDHFRHCFADVRAAAAEDVPEGFEIDHLMPGRDMLDPKAFTVKMEQLTFMALRHTAVTRLAEAECDNSLIATITGHSQVTVSTIIERYMVRTAKMARLAFQRRVDAETPAAAAAETVKGVGA